MENFPALLALALATSLVAAREINFYGISYKVEAAVAIVTSFATIYASLAFPETAAPLLIVWGLAMALLAFGKLLEPAESDWAPSGSDFLGDDPLD